MKKNSQRKLYKQNKSYVICVPSNIVKELDLKSGDNLEFVARGQMAFMKKVEEDERG